MVISLRDTSGKDLWVAPIDGADIAAIQAPPVSKLGPHPHAISIADVANHEDLFEGATIIALGYPGVVGNEYLVRAISRSGIVSWLNPNDPYGKPFLIDSNIYPGNSGGPVIRVPTGLDRQGTFVVGGRIALLGIVSQAPGQQQRMSLRVPGVLMPLTLEQTVPIGGTGVIEPANKIPELIKLLNRESTASQP